MKSDKGKVDYDLSILTLEELIETYKNITEFLKYLEASRIDMGDTDE